MTTQDTAESTAILLRCYGHRVQVASDGPSVCQADLLRQEIKRITGMEVREATAEIEPASGAVVQAFTTGTVVQVFLLNGRAPTEAWSGTRPGNES